ncbi:MAG: hypothetical protein IJW92_06425 [Clostridia bacterium]|nr:hypothetical protein [Clostridia bacterium]
MKRKTIKAVMIATLIVLCLVMITYCTARFVFLAPSCYLDSDKLTAEENYFIKKIVLDAVEDRLSIFGDTNDSIYASSASDNEIIQLDQSQNNRRHILVLINSDFMYSIVKAEDEYTVRLQTYFMESASENCTYEIHISSNEDGYFITFFGLDP